MRAKSLLPFLLLTLLLLPAIARAQRPNLVLIITDDQGYGDLSCNGNPHLKTPNIDLLRAEGVSLERFYVSPVCSPTRAALMTGRYNYRTGVVDTYIGRSMMHPDEVTLAEQLRAAGWRTGIFGKWHLGDTFPLRALDQGFEESLVCRGGGIGQPSDPPDNGYFNPLLQKNGIETPSTGYCTDVFTDAGIAFMRAHAAEPFFLYLPYNAPHAPLEVDAKYAQPFLEMGLDEDTARIYGMVANIDENVGRVMEALKYLQLDERTLVLFMTDNGAQMRNGHERFNAGMRAGKGTPYEGGIRVPCFLRWPGKLTPGRTIDQTCAHIDLAPTLMEAFGVPPADAPRQDGRSLWPLLTGAEDSLPPRPLFLQWHRGDAPRPFEGSAVVEQQYKLVNGAELFDLSADPAEAHDLAAAKPEEVQRMRGAYEAWLADVSATRGYDPPRIVLAPKEAPETLLTPQDWRGTEDFGPSNNAWWEVVTSEKGDYVIELDFRRTLWNATATLDIGGEHIEQAIFPQATMCRFRPIHLPAGLQTRLEFKVRSSGGVKAVRYVRVWRE